jgi:4-hydroxy-tetrahydrodipicolinate synthase
MSRGLKPGVHCIAATPFLPDESLDLASIGTLMDYLAASGCKGALVLGVLGEADRLSDKERDQVLVTALELGGDRLQISVGITHNSTNVTKTRAEAAQAVGVAGVMVSPPTGSVAGPALREHFKRISSNLTIPLIVQDHPTSSGVKLPVEFIASLYEFLPPGSVCKLEDPPTPIKMNKLRELEPGYQIFGGLGGVSLLHELDAGSAGAMTGFAVAELLVEIVTAFQNGDRAHASDAYERALPLMVFEAQPGAGVALRKEILRRRGAIAHATVRQPAPTPDRFALALLDDLMESVPAGVAS